MLFSSGIASKQVLWTKLTSLGSSHQNGERKQFVQNQTGRSATLLSLSQCHVTKSFKIMSNMVEPVPELEFSQEEADTRMMLHLAHISQYDFSCAVIASIDADVTFLCLTNYHKFPMPLFQKCCSETRLKYVDIASIGNVLGRNVCESIPWNACNYRMWHSKQLCLETKIVCISISEEERFIPRTFCQVWFKHSLFPKKMDLARLRCDISPMPGLDPSGSSVMQTLPNYRCLLAHCMVPKSLMSTLSGTNCSAPNKQTLKDISFLFVLPACTSTGSVPVTKQLFRKEHWMLSLKFQVRLEKGASRTKVMLLPFQLTGWKACQLQMQYWNWCLAHVRVFVNPTV